ncbi:hypothetical protein Leryth_001857 [Lithospermum erythrorhizon]|nr:hypothetical protein Leryth_001857 [Lithospermum erythrorhizon]
MAYAPVQPPQQDTPKAPPTFYIFPSTFWSKLSLRETCKHMSSVTCSIPEFTCVSSAKLVKLLESREANHIEFCRIKSVVDEILYMYRSIELNKILRSLMDPTWAATGLKVDLETLVEQCRQVSSRIGDIISLEGEHDWKISSHEYVPKDFFEDMESSWKCRVKKVHVEEVLAEVDKAVKDLGLAVSLYRLYFPIDYATLNVMFARLYRV